MTLNERAMLDFALRWSPFGNDGDEYILPEFGLTPATFYQRVLTLVTTGTVRIDAATCSLLERICLDKLSRPTRLSLVGATSAVERVNHHPRRATARKIS